jgi:predicted acetyltransferase
MSFPLRPIKSDELPALADATGQAFGSPTPDDFALDGWRAHELDRTLAAFDGDDIVGTGRCYSFELTMPGGAVVPAAGVSWIATLPTHRRRGVLRSIIERQLDDAVTRDEPVAILNASEGSIYRRFGFGESTFSCQIEVDRRSVQFRNPTPVGRVRLLSLADARVQLPAIYERVRVVQPGAVSRPTLWWGHQYFDAETDRPKARYYVVYESADGSADGFAGYDIDAQYADNVPNSTLSVRDLAAVTPDAYHALWEYLVGVDLVQTISAFNAPPDAPLRWLLRDSRAVRTKRLGDWLWVRVLDTARVLAERRYAVAGELVIEVRDASRSTGAAAGCFELSGGPEAATCARSNRPSDLVMDVAELGSILLGGVVPSTLAYAGTIEVRNASALELADAMFRSSPLPFSMTWF